MSLSLWHYHLHGYSYEHHYFLHSRSQLYSTFQESQKRALWSYFHILIKSWVKEKGKHHVFLPTLTTSSFLNLHPTPAVTVGIRSKEKQRGEGRGREKRKWELGGGKSDPENFRFRNLKGQGGLSTPLPATSAKRTSPSSPVNETRPPPAMPPTP